MRSRETLVLPFFIAYPVELAKGSNLIQAQIDERLEVHFRNKNVLFPLAEHSVNVSFSFAL